MANKTIFKSKRGSTKAVPVADTTNRAGGKAYKFEKKHCLAQIACTNCFGGTFYASAENNLALAKEACLALKDDPQFLAKVAIYSRSKGYMKDMPAFIMTVLADTDTALFRQVFPRVIDNGKMLRNFCQIARSGVATGRSFNLSAGACRRAIQSWFDNADSDYIFRASVGNDPSLADVLKMARVRPSTKEKAALFAYILGADIIGTKVSLKGPGKELRVHKKSDLPKIVKEFEKFKATKEGPAPDVDFQLLTALDLGKSEWTDIAKNARWTMTRMNLATFARHGVFEDKKMVKMIADRLRDGEQIRKAKVFPYQLLMAFKANENNGVPHDVTEALQDAMEIAVSNTPTIPGQVYVAIDVSGSMGSSITGYGRGHTSAVRCVDVASLYAASILRQNKSAVLYPFDDKVHRGSFNGRDSVMTNADKLAKYGGGGTDCSCVLRKLNQENAKGSAVILISDMESWIDGGHYYWGASRGTSVLTEWNKFQGRNPDAKLICIDLQARDNSQVTPRKNILQVGGFSDTVFDVVANFVEYGHETDHWVAEIEEIPLD